MAKAIVHRANDAQVVQSDFTMSAHSRNYPPQNIPRPARPSPPRGTDSAPTKAKREGDVLLPR